MPYLQLDLDAKKKIPHAARIAGIPECQLGWGLLDLWELCWLKKKDCIPLDLLEGIFGAPGERVARALVAFEFAEATGEDEIRVRGAKRYLRISEVRSEAGKARAGGSRDEKGRLLPKSAGPAEPQHPTSKRPANAGRSASTRPAKDQPLHRAPNTEHLEEDPPPPAREEFAASSPPDQPTGGSPRAVVEPEKPPRAPALAFLAFAEETNPNLWRKPPEQGSFVRWYAGAIALLRQHGMGDDELRAGYERFCADEWAQKRSPPCPWTVWVKQFEQYLPLEHELPPPAQAPEEPTTPAGKVWATALDRLRAEGVSYGVQQIQQAQISAATLRGSTLVLSAPSEHAAEWVSEHYGGLLADALATAGFRLTLTTPSGLETPLEAPASRA